MKLGQETEPRAGFDEVTLEKQYTDAQARAEQLAFDLLTARTALADHLAQETDPDVLKFLWERTFDEAIKLLACADQALKARYEVLKGQGK